MNKKIKRVSALIAASLANTEQYATADTIRPQNEVTNDESIPVAVLNNAVSTELAAHRSHSSHSSHRSSSGGSYRTPRSAPAPVYTPPPKPEKRSDPLGQQPRPLLSIPQDIKNKPLSEKLKNKEAKRNIIMRMQLTLQFEGYYAGAIDGIMGPGTRAAVLKYKIDKGIPGSTVLDAATLNALGIIGY